MTARPRGFIVVTGSELVRGDRHDLNGPFLAGELLRHGVEPARISIVGDREEELSEALAEGLGGADLCVVSGGLGPTHDDRTVELVARAAGVGLRLDEELHEQIGGISRAFAERLGRPYVDFEAGVRKQAMIPEGAHSLGLAGTAPGLVLEHGDTVVVVLPGPPAELQRLWSSALESRPVQELLARTKPPELRQLRFFGVSESAVAKALADAGGDGNGVEATICARDFEIHVDLVVEPGAETRADELSERLVTPLERHLFGRDEREAHLLCLDCGSDEDSSELHLESSVNERFDEPLCLRRPAGHVVGVHDRPMVLGQVARLVKLGDRRAGVRLPIRQRRAKLFELLSEPQLDRTSMLAESKTHREFTRAIQQHEGGVSSDVRLILASGKRFLD